MSSMQVDARERGFSYSYDAPLDMRMDPDAGARRAAEIVNEWAERRLARAAARATARSATRGRIAREIVRARGARRSRRPASWSTRSSAAIPAPARFGGGHPAKRTFQAIRIAVNGELGSLDARAARWPGTLLRVGGRLAAISFHSLEDRRVKRFLADRARGCICPPELPVCVCGREPEAELLTRRAVAPDARRGRRQPARGPARLRAARKLDAEDDGAEADARRGGRTPAPRRRDARATRRAATAAPRRRAPRAAPRVRGAGPRARARPPPRRAALAAAAAAPRRRRSRARRLAPARPPASAAARWIALLGVAADRASSLMQVSLLKLNAGIGRARRPRADAASARTPSCAARSRAARLERAHRRPRRPSSGMVIPAAGDVALPRRPRADGRARGAASAAAGRCADAAPAAPRPTAARRRRRHADARPRPRRRPPPAPRRPTRRRRRDDRRRHDRDRPTATDGGRDDRAHAAPATPRRPRRPGRRRGAARRAARAARASRCALIERRIGLLFAAFLALLLARGRPRAVWLRRRQGPSSLKRAAASQQVSRRRRCPAQRGTILDRHGDELAVSEAADDVFATPYLVKDPVGDGAPSSRRCSARPDDDAAAQARRPRHAASPTSPARSPAEPGAQRSQKLEIAGHRAPPTSRAHLPAGRARRAGDRRGRHRRQRA